MGMFTELEAALTVVQAKKKALDTLSDQVTAASDAYQTALKDAQAKHAKVSSDIGGILPGSHVRVA
jgi:hypothetical protein